MIQARAPQVEPRARLPLGRAAARAIPALAASSLFFAGYQLERRFTADEVAQRDRWVRRWSVAMMRSLRVRLTVDDASRDRLSARSAVPRLLVANHRSTIDIFVMLSLFDGHMLARGDMARWPLMGTLARAAQTIFVDRNDPHSGAASVKAMRDRLKSGRAIGVFPEGTTFPGDEVRPFHAGAFLAVARERGTVTPIGIAYARDDVAFGDESFRDHARRLLAMSEIRVAASVGEPISSKGLGVHALSERAQQAVQAKVAEARAQL